MFEKKTGMKVKVVARGTGASIEMAKRGDPDMLVVHAKEQELKAVEEGYFVNRHDVGWIVVRIQGQRALMSPTRKACNADSA